MEKIETASEDINSKNNIEENTYVNVTEEVIKKLNSIGFRGKVRPIIRFYLGEDISEVFGDENFDSRDVDFTLCGNTIEVIKIERDEDGNEVSKRDFNITVSYNEPDDSKRIQCIENINGNPYLHFEITVNPKWTSLVRNDLLVSNDENGLLHVREYEYQQEDKVESFRYRLIVPGVNEEKSVKYNATLNPMYARVNDSDWFTYTRVFPPKEKSILKNMVDEISGRGDSRRIKTSVGALDMEDYASEIFEELKKDASYVLKAQNEKGKKLVR